MVRFCGAQKSSISLFDPLYSANRVGISFDNLSFSSLPLVFFRAPETEMYEKALGQAPFYSNCWIFQVATPGTISPGRKLISLDQQLFFASMGNQIKLVRPDLALFGRSVWQASNRFFSLFSSVERVFRSLHANESSLIKYWTLNTVELCLGLRKRNKYSSHIRTQTHIHTHIQKGSKQRASKGRKVFIANKWLLVILYPAYRTFSDPRCCPFLCRILY